MTLEEAYYFSQIIAGVAILASLGAVFFQLRQVNRQSRQANDIARSELTLNSFIQTGALHYSFVDDPEKADFMFRAMFGEAPLNDSEKLRFGNLMGYAVGGFEAAFMLRQRGLIEPAAYDRNEGLMKLYFQTRRVRKWWRTRREFNYDPEIRAIIDAMSDSFETAPSPAQPPRAPA